MEPYFTSTFSPPGQISSAAPGPGLNGSSALFSEPLDFGRD